MENENSTVLHRKNVSMVVRRVIKLCVMMMVFVLGTRAVSVLIVPTEEVMIKTSVVLFLVYRLSVVMISRVMINQVRVVSLRKNGILPQTAVLSVRILKPQVSSSSMSTNHISIVREGIYCTIISNTNSQKLEVVHRIFLIFM